MRRCTDKDTRHALSNYEQLTYRKRDELTSIAYPHRAAKGSTDENKKRARRVSINLVQRLESHFVLVVHLGSDGRGLGSTWRPDLGEIREVVLLDLQSSEAQIIPKREERAATKLVARTEEW